MTFQTTEQRQSVLLNGAGDSVSFDSDGDIVGNPILSGLDFAISAKFDQVAKQVSGLAGTTSPPTTAISFSQDIEESTLYQHQAVAGVAPFANSIAVGNSSITPTFVRVNYSSADIGDQTVWEKKLYIAPLPEDAVQVWDIVNQEWVSVNFGTNPNAIPTCCQHCGMRFFNGWFDEFRVPKFGGVKYVSLYDWGSTEEDAVQLQVSRDIEREISRERYVYLQKHVLATIENHDFAVEFKTEKSAGITGASDGIVIRVKVKSVACWGFEMLDPETS